MYVIKAIKGFGTICNNNFRDELTFYMVIINSIKAMRININYYT